MKKNIGGLDKGLRIVAGLIVVGVGAYLQSWWGLIGVVFIGTALLSWCPPYAMFGISTCKVKK